MDSNVKITITALERYGIAMLLMSRPPKSAERGRMHVSAAKAVSNPDHWTDVVSTAIEHRPPKPAIVAEVGKPKSADSAPLYWDQSFNLDLRPEQVQNIIDCFETQPFKFDEEGYSSLWGYAALEFIDKLKRERDAAKSV